MKKRVFQIFDEMNVADEKNGTQLLGMCNYLVEARTAKGGGHVTIGVPAEVVQRLQMNSENTRVILIVFNYDDYERFEGQ